MTAAVSGTYGTPEAWRDMLASVAGAVATAEAHGVTLAFKPEPGNVVDSAAAGRRLLDEIRSPHLRVVRDAADLVAGAGLDRQAATLREAFHLLGDDVVLAHAKDVRRDGAIVAAGRGDLARRLPTGAPIGVASSPPPVVPCPAACPVQVIRLPTARHAMMHRP